jgi:hypothetical protein
MVGSMKKTQPIWTPGCGRPHPDLALILLWAEGKITLIEKQRVSDEGKNYGEPVRVQYPCWNPDSWKFDVARNSQMTLDLTEALVSTRPAKVRKLPLGPGRQQDYSAQR